MAREQTGPVYRFWLHIGFVVLCVFVYPGCGDTKTPVAQVHGKVELDGQPLKSGAVSTIPTAGRGAHGEIRDGNFELGTFGQNDGAIIGTHKVAIMAYEPSQGKGPEAGPGKLLVPQRYINAGSSGLEIEVKAGEVNTPTLKLTSP